MSGSHTDALLDWLREVLAEYELEPIAVYRAGANANFPLTANSEKELQETLLQGGHFLPLPKEPAALANILEVSLSDFIIKKVSNAHGITCFRGTERGYPDMEISGDRFGGGYYAVDIKGARRKSYKRPTNNPQTQSRITLYTGNTYFAHPTLKWPGSCRAFDDYSAHLSIIVIYTLNEECLGRVDNMELIVHESWRLGSTKRSSKTREYIGAVTSINQLALGNGEFRNKEQFYKYWRKFKFNESREVNRQLYKALDEARSAEKT